MTALHYLGCDEPGCDQQYGPGVIARLRQASRADGWQFTGHIDRCPTHAGDRRKMNGRRHIPEDMDTTLLYTRNTADADPAVVARFKAEHDTLGDAGFADLLEQRWD